MGSWGAVGTPAPGAVGGAHLRLRTGFEPELAQDVEQRQLELQEPQPHPEAAPGARPKRQVRVGPPVLLSLGCEPAGQQDQDGPGTPPPYTELPAPPTRQVGPQPSTPPVPRAPPPGVCRIGFCWTRQSPRLRSRWPPFHMVQSGLRSSCPAKPSRHCLIQRITGNINFALSASPYEFTAWLMCQQTH